MYLKQPFLFFTFLITSCFCRAQTFPGIQWNKCFGGTDLDYLVDIQETFDGGYITAGFTYSNDGDVTNYRDSGDCWIVKLKSSGDVEWQKTFGGNGYDAAWCVQQTKDSGYIIGGHSLSTDGDISVNQGGLDLCVIKLDKQGNLEWQHSYGGSLDDYIRSIIQTSDGGYFVGGNTNSNDGDVSGNHGGSDFWLIKLDSIGNLLWQKCLGGQWNDHCNAAIQTKDGGFAVTGALDVNIPFTKLSYTIKIDSAGNVEWELPVYDMWMEECSQIMQTIDGGYILPGSYRVPISNNSYYKKAHLLRLKADGTIEWRKRFTTGIHSSFLSIAPSGDSGYIAGGHQTVENAGYLTPIAG
ncbi:MAG: hypothetical protein IPP72_17715 [Chitinophagaceae bacterium]|nr:hypothetical protein [Chitinophagaceae bacterium]